MCDARFGKSFQVVDEGAMGRGLSVMEAVAKGDRLLRFVPCLAYGCALTHAGAEVRARAHYLSSSLDVTCRCGICAARAALWPAHVHARTWQTRSTAILAGVARTGAASTS